MADPVLTFTEKGIFCPAGGFYIDPHRKVDRALVTHGHSDHARPGMGAYLTTHAALPVIRHRLGRIAAEGIAWGEPRRIGGATVSFHPAGHVPGSAQIRVEVAGEVWVVSGDYKTEDDGFAEAFEPVAAHGFVTECTFGLPVYRWQPQAQVTGDLLTWWQGLAEQRRPALVAAWSFGKAQRLIAALAGLAPLPGPILTHPAVEAVNRVLRTQGYPLPDTLALDQARPEDFAGALILHPPSAQGGPWADRLADAETALASGWAAVGRHRQGRGAMRGFALSDHADWPGLNAAIRATGATRVVTVHGYTGVFARWLRDQGYDAAAGDHTPPRDEAD